MRYILFILFCLFCVNVYGGDVFNPFTGYQDVVPDFEETDGVTDALNVTKIRVPVGGIASTSPETVTLDFLTSADISTSAGAVTTVYFGETTYFEWVDPTLTLYVNGTAMQAWTHATANYYLLLDDGASYLLLDDGSSKLIIR